MVRIAVGVLVCLLSVAEARAQTLSGRVLDADTGLPIAGAALQLVSTDGELTPFERISGEGGGFVFGEVPAGRYRLKGERLGYRETVSPFVAIEAGDTVAFEFRMATEAFLLEPLTVTASARPWYEHLTPPTLWEYYERREHLSALGRGRFLGPEELTVFAGMPVSLAIGTVVGMKAVASERGGRFHVLGRRGCDALFFMNGQQVRLRPPELRADTNRVGFVPGPTSLEWFMDDFVSMNDVEAIEVYRGASELPGEFHGFNGNGNCGAVVVWTKRTVDRRGGEV